MKKTKKLKTKKQKNAFTPVYFIFELSSPNPFILKPMIDQMKNSKSKNRNQITCSNFDFAK